jgi:hypothetical protein
LIVHHKVHNKVHRRLTIGRNLDKECKEACNCKYNQYIFAQEPDFEDPERVPNHPFLVIHKNSNRRDLDRNSQSSKEKSKLMLSKPCKLTN